ncbi:hypothetical protein IMY05_C4479000700 [Salix suchowensis]|nr:hypothetical protein IMY05_C4479000700 [Salix suchowensis]
MTKSKSSPLQIRVHRGFIQCSYVTEWSFSLTPNFNFLNLTTLSLPRRHGYVLGCILGGEDSSAFNAGIATTMKGALKADFTASSLSQDSTRSPTIPARSGEATSDMRSMESGSVSQPAPPIAKAPTASTPYGGSHNVQSATTNNESPDYTSQSATLGSGGLHQGASPSLNSFNQETFVHDGGTAAGKFSQGRKTPPCDAKTTSGVYNEKMFAKVPGAETGPSMNNVTAVHPEFIGDGSFNDLMHSGHLIEDTRQLQRECAVKVTRDGSSSALQLAVVHERIVSFEVEEITREKHLERHGTSHNSVYVEGSFESLGLVHHIQHHVVPIIHREEGEEHLHHQVGTIRVNAWEKFTKSYQAYPVSHVVEHHTGKAEDQALLESILKQGNTTVSILFLLYP